MIDPYIELIYSLKEEIGKLNLAFMQVEQLLGPEPAQCGCSGCAVEQGDALQVVQKVLRGEWKKKDYDSYPLKTIHHSNTDSL